MDLRRANDGGATEWRPLYKLSETYGVPDLSVESMEKVLLMLEESEVAFQTYYRFNTVAHEEGRSTPKKLCSVSVLYISHPCNNISALCDLTCWQGHICAISQVTTEGMNACLLKKSPKKELSDIWYVTDDSMDDFDEGMSSEGRFIAAGIFLVVGLLVILLSIFAFNIRYMRRARQYEYYVLSD